MTSILSSLLDINGLESGNLRPSVSEFSLNEIFEPLADDFAAPAQDRGLRLLFDPILSSAATAACSRR